jgi:hypothetical protein
MGIGVAVFLQHGQRLSSTQFPNYLSLSGIASEQDHILHSRERQYSLFKKNLYPGSSFRMLDELLETYICQYIEAQKILLATIAWQGGEPTLMGLDFFRWSIQYEQKYSGPL